MKQNKKVFNFVLVSLNSKEKRKEGGALKMQRN